MARPSPSLDGMGTPLPTPHPLNAYGASTLTPPHREFLATPLVVISISSFIEITQHDNYNRITRQAAGKG